MVWCCHHRLRRNRPILDKKFSRDFFISSPPILLNLRTNIIGTELRLVLILDIVTPSNSKQKATWYKKWLFLGFFCTWRVYFLFYFDAIFLS